MRIVDKIIADIKTRGDEAVIQYTKKFDNVTLSPRQFKLSPAEVKKIAKSVKNKEFIEAVRIAYNNIYRYHQNYFLKTFKPFTYKRDGLEIKCKFIPIESVCIYIPGGTYPYVSTVLMNVIPAKVAKVKNIYLTTPPKNITPELVYTAVICKIKEIYRIGGAQAIAAFAYGTKSIPKVDKIVGPGNIYVTLAKKQVYGDVGIDMLAGPTEIVIYADDPKVNYEYVLFDLLAQAEHDTRAKAILITPLNKLAKFVERSAPAEFKNRIKIINSNRIEESVKLINRIAPEHLEIISKNANYIINKIKNAGVILNGRFSSAVLSDYVAGPSHTLPTGETVKFSSVLSVKDFIKEINIIKYKRKNLEDIEAAKVLSSVERMKYHKEALNVRT